MTTPHTIPTLQTVLMLLVFGTSGCFDGRGNLPELAPVSGTVTLDGVPQEGATVLFQPVAAGRPSAGETDAQGRYVLKYTVEEEGAMVGEHKVTIRKEVPSKSPQGESIYKETMPAEYNRKSTLTETVESGDNVINFDLKSKP